MPNLSQQTGYPVLDATGVTVGKNFYPVGSWEHKLTAEILQHFSNVPNDQILKELRSHRRARAHKHLRRVAR